MKFFPAILQACKLLVCICCLIISLGSACQVTTTRITWNDFIKVYTDTVLSPVQKLNSLLTLKHTFEVTHLQQDSTYAAILSAIGANEFALKNYNAAIANTLSSVAINTSGKKNASKHLAVQSYYNLACYYTEISLNRKALDYFDSTMQLATIFKDEADFILYSKVNRVRIFFMVADYQKYEEECIAGINYSLKVRDTAKYLYFFIQQAQADLIQKRLIEATAKIEKAVKLCCERQDIENLGFALIIKADIFKEKGLVDSAIAVFKNAIVLDLQNHDSVNAANIYRDIGDIYLANFNNYTVAKKYYQKVIYLGKQINDFVKVAEGYTSLGKVYFDERKYDAASACCLSLFKYLNINCNSILLNPRADELRLIQSNRPAILVMAYKTALLLQLYKTTNQKVYLDACIQTALVTDTIISRARHEQLGELSKLIGREDTRQFYLNAIEACFLEKNETYGFYFMEKSRAALLNDNLNELVARAYLPGDVLVKEQSLKMNALSQQRALLLLPKGSNAYTDQEDKLLHANYELEQYARLLEKNYPLYYQYKYADNIPALKDVKKYLLTGNRSFVYYFSTDTCMFMMTISAAKTSFNSVTSKDFNSSYLYNFQKLCANRQALNNDYPAFAKLSNQLYNKIFNPLGIAPGNVIICTDNFLIPFEALCTNATGKDFLIDNYTFSYVYSAGYLLRKFEQKQPEGNFLGIAPVSFTAQANLPSLRGSEKAMKQSSGYFNSTQLQVAEDATRQNFFKLAPKYALVTIYSHASADTVNNGEPIIYMRDSSIRLSDLGYYNNPATQLVILSACETNAGKKAEGEGIYSLARGFSAAGIPAVAATLWQANDQATYAITEEFNRNLANGMQKDEALRQAKLVYIKQGKPNMLPYFWANIIITGNIQPLRLTAPASYTPAIICMAVPLLFMALIVIYLTVLRNKKRRFVLAATTHNIVLQ